MRIPFVTFLPMEKELNEELKAAFDRVFARSWYIGGVEDEAFEKASLDGVITVDMVSGILLAENFSMPAGYVSEDGIDHLVKVGDKYTDMAALSSQLLFHIDVEGVGDVRVRNDLSEQEWDVLSKGGLLNAVRARRA